MDPEERLRTAVARHERERVRASEHLATVDARRDEAIRRAAADGLTRREIADIVGVSFQRIQQIVRGTDGDQVRAKSGP